MWRVAAILLCLYAGACSGPTQVDPLAAAGLAGSGLTLVETPEEFGDRVVGQTLAGSGFRARILPGGGLSGLYVGERFEGRWSFRDGIYCQSLTQDMSGPTYGCFHVAVRGDDVRLLPVADR